ncbi:SDR family oxidoreductase [Zooshikella marina]|uniref:SDR family oxidoreductase n=1 Tax=Zooshikella ganghwensis TaxID=202772 RepID=UPI001BAEBD38|nr:SDR family oxidoreductase [Zooshikella ganghwensis]MBU2708123.1 SDR family oxidoreductase [Zooshikella ganghwensis]
MSKQQNILITGANSGFGLLTTKLLLQQGHHVVASMRDPNHRNAQTAHEIKQLGGMVVDIDVTNEESVTTGITEAIKLAGHLDVLVNNAGVGVLGLQEAFTTDDIKSVFEINVFGLNRMIRAILPHFHQRHSGLILNVSSILGRMTIPFYGPYNASKWAVEALSENYRTELSKFGIDVTIVEPGGFPTEFIDRLVKPSDTVRLQHYGDMAAAPQAALEGFEQALAANPAQNPQLVADAIADVIAKTPGSRPFRTVVDKMGMGEPIAAYNEQLATITKNIYQAFGTAEMLELNVKENEKNKLSIKIDI